MSLWQLTGLFHPEAKSKKLFETSPVPLATPLDAKLMCEYLLCSCCLTLFTGWEIFYQMITHSKVLSNADDVHTHQNNVC